MSATEYRFIEPLDVLILRSNKLFGDPGSYGECLIPPWPSVAAGAIRSRILADDHIDLAAFSKGAITHSTLGTPQQPGSFVVTGFHLARHTGKAVEILAALPADLVIAESGQARLSVSALTPLTLATGILTSSNLPLLPVLAQGTKRSKATAGYWLTQAGWAAYLQGKIPTTEQLVHSSSLWAFDARVGIGLNDATRSVDNGKLFSSQAVAMKNGIGFLAAIRGANAPSNGLLRFGGDGRAASIKQVTIQPPQPDYEAITKARRCRLVLTSPGLFPNGWKLPGTDAENRVTLAAGITARLACITVARSETVSGWDLASWQPKPAQRVAPTGSVYWLDELDASPDALRKLVENGLWEASCEDAARRAEGFNRLTLAIWS